MIIIAPQFLLIAVSRLDRSRSTAEYSFQLLTALFLLRVGKISDHSSFRLHLLHSNYKEFGLAPIELKLNRKVFRKQENCHFHRKS